MEGNVCCFVDIFCLQLETEITVSLLLFFPEVSRGSVWWTDSLSGLWERAPAHRPPGTVLAGPALCANTLCGSPPRRPPPHGQASG